MGIFYFPCDFVYWKKIDSHEKYKSRLLQKLHENDNLLSNTHSSYLTNASTTVESLGHWITNSDKDIIEDIVWKSLDELITKLNARPNCSKLKINNSVWNKNDLCLFSTDVDELVKQWITFCCSLDFYCLTTKIIGNKNIQFFHFCWIEKTEALQM